MVSDQEIAKGVETLLRQSEPNAFTSVNGVVQQLEAKLGLDLSHKAVFIRDQINLLLRSHPQHQQQQPQHQHQHQHQHQYQQQHHHHPKDHFALHPPPTQTRAQAQAQYPTALHPHPHPQPQQFSPHFAFHPYHHRPIDAHTFQPPSAPPPHVHPPAKPELFAHNVSAVPSEMPKESAPVGTKRRGGPGGLNKVCGVSPELQAIVGEPAMPRTEIVKQLWAYIRKNNLQDPSNKRKIICDDALRVVFETDCTDMFKMNKLLAKHIIALEPTKGASQAKRVKVDIEPTPESTDTASSCVIISEPLAKFLDTGGREMLRSEALSRVWEYIKVNHLEDPLNSMAILCDAKLRELLGCESISALGISEMLERHHLFQQS